MITFKMFLENKMFGDIIMLKGGYYLERDSASSNNLHAWFIRRLMEDEILGNAKQRFRTGGFSAWWINVPARHAFDEVAVSEEDVFDNSKFKEWVIDNLAVLRMINLRGPSAD